MTLPKKHIDAIDMVIENSLRKAFENYSPEPASMPFHVHLLGKDRLALYSFIHSLNTNFGTTIFEPVAVSLAQREYKSAQKQYNVGNMISIKAQAVIQSIIDDLSANAKPNKIKELE